MIRRSRANAIRQFLGGVTIVAAATLASVAVYAKDPEVTGVRIGVNPDPRKLPSSTTRVVLDVSSQTPYSAFLLGDPYRLVIDLPEMDWQVNGESSLGPKGVVEKLRYGLFRPGNSRVVVDLAEPVKIATHQSLKRPNRLMFDLVPVPANTFRSGEIVSTANWRPPVASPTPSPGPAQKSGDSRRVIVIDPGHGGVDPGAVRGNTYEKNITLAIALETKRLLDASGRYRVILTRDRDVFLELRDRIEVGRRNGADLFLSLHADTHPKTATRGASVYTLSEKASDAEAAALAAKENRVDVIAGVDLSGHSDAVVDLLIDLRQRQTMNESAVFANSLIGQFGRNKVNVLSKTHRFAGFAVLKSPDVPSVLVELGYLSNWNDRKMLLTRNFHRRAASAILASLDEYFKRRDELSRSG